MAGGPSRAVPKGPVPLRDCPSRLGYVPTVLLVPRPPLSSVGALQGHPLCLGTRQLWELNPGWARANIPATTHSPGLSVVVFLSSGEYSLLLSCDRLRPIYFKLCRCLKLFLNFEELNL